MIELVAAITIVITTPDAPTIPLCAVEDCSDQPAQRGIWVDPDTGTQWLSLGEHSVPIGPGDVEPDTGEYVGGYN